MGDLAAAERIEDAGDQFLRECWVCAGSEGSTLNPKYPADDADSMVSIAVPGVPMAEEVRVD